MYDIFVAEGDKLVRELITQDIFEIDSIYATDKWLNLHHQSSQIMGCNPVTISETDMEQITLLKTASPVYLLLKRRSEVVNFELISSGYSFYVDGVQDPGNLGTIIRIADWFGFKAVLRSPESADFYNPKTVQASMGSLGAVHLATVSGGELTTWNKSNVLVGMDMNGQNMTNVSFANGTIFVMGSEGNGISKDIQNLISQTISISGSQHRIAESLNVSVAAGILAHHVTSF